MKSFLTMWQFKVILEPFLEINHRVKYYRVTVFLQPSYRRKNGYIP
jgi:hypothetical protein